MKYLKYLKESIISDKIDRLEDLTFNLKDNDLMVDFIKSNPYVFILRDGTDHITYSPIINGMVINTFLF